MVFHTLTGHEISDRTAFELNVLYKRSRGEHLAGRLWREVLTEEERRYLGRFRNSYLNEHFTVGMYRRLYPRLTLERAVLEVMRHVGSINEARYERLVEEIHELPELPPGRGGRPVWDGKNLYFNRDLARTIRQPKSACRQTAILNAFQKQSWPPHVNRESIGKWNAKDLSEAVGILNRGLKRMKFSMDGSGTGVIWQPV